MPLLTVAVLQHAPATQPGRVHLALLQPTSNFCHTDGGAALFLHRLHPVREIGEGGVREEGIGGCCVRGWENYSGRVHKSWQHSLPPSPHEEGVGVWDGGRGGGGEGGSYMYSVGVHVH